MVGIQKYFRKNIEVESNIKNNYLWSKEIPGYH